MNPIRFNGKARREFTATLKKNVNDYFKENGISPKGGTRMIWKSVVMLSLYLAPFVLLMTLPLSGWTIFPLAVLAGIGMAGTGMAVMHDAVHGSFSHRTWLNKVFGHSMYLIGGSTFTWKVQHNLLHHTYTNIHGHDEDINTKVVIRLSPHAPLKKMHRFQHFYAIFFYSLMTISKLVSDFTAIIKYNKTGLTKQQQAKPAAEFLKMTGFKLLYFALFFALPLILMPFAWWQVLLLFVIMHLTASIIMSIVFQMAHVVEETEQPQPDEEGKIGNEWTIHELQTTANFAKHNRVLGWLIGGLNFQIEHHLFPHISHIHYPKIAPIVERTAQEFGLVYNHVPTFGKAIGSHLRMLKSLGRNVA